MGRMLQTAEYILPNVLFVYDLKQFQYFSSIFKKDNSIKK